MNNPANSPTSLSKPFKVNEKLPSPWWDADSEEAAKTNPPKQKDFYTKRQKIIGRNIVPHSRKKHLL